MELLIVPLLAALLHCTTAETGEAYHGPPQAREMFSYDDILFHFYSDRASYDEAKAICDAQHMHLTQLDSPGKAKFAAESIAEAWMVFEDMWIGGKKKERGMWYWEWTNKRIAEDSVMVDNQTYLYPPWIDNELPARDGKDCLAVDRNGHNDPYFVDLDCAVPRPFICEQNTRMNKTDPWIGGSVEIFNMQYILYHGRLTWSGAVSFCQQQGFALATVENMSVARKLAKAMLKSRPEFEDAWIGAYLKPDGWVWVETGEEIKTVPGVYRNPDKAETPENTITPQFPPWFETQPRKGRECTIFDRHLCDEPKFIDLKCNRQRDFICIKRESTEENIEPTFILDREKKRYIFFPILSTWDEAKRICSDEGESTTMLNLTDIEETKFVMQAMADARKPIDHVWLGGRIIDNQWMWIVRDENDDDTIPIPTKIDSMGFPPWCDNETNPEMACLNLDRQNHWTPLIYGLECNSSQPVVCVQPAEPNDMIVHYEGSDKTDPPVDLRVTKLSSQNAISWMEAEDVCKREIGKLWRPRFDIQESTQPMTNLFKLLQEKQNTDNPDRDVEVYHIDGGRYDKKVGSWVYNKKPINITTGWEAFDGDCLVGQINKTSTEWTWFPVKCYHKLYSQVICEPRCSLKQVPYEKAKSDWICDAASSNVFDHKMIGMGCNHRCPDSRVLVGPERYQCLKERGWISKQNQLPVDASSCVEMRSGLNSLQNIPKEVSTLAFVIDSTSDSPSDYSVTKYLIGNLIDYYRAFQKSITVHIVSIEQEANSKVAAEEKVANFKPTEDCKELREKVLDTLVDKGEGKRDYGAGLSAVKESLKGLDLGETHIVFIVPEANQKGNFKEIARELNTQAKIYAIGTNKHVPINQLVDVASKIDKKSYAIQFKKPPHVIEAVRSLTSKCEKCKCKAAFDDLLAETLEKAREFGSDEDLEPGEGDGDGSSTDVPGPQTTHESGESSIAPEPEATTHAETAASQPEPQPEPAPQPEPEPQP